MKLYHLKIKNIASIEEAEIDFVNGPLGENSTFLITGPTGTGKSTILDCICLALYNTTPRLKDAASETYMDNFGQESRTTHSNQLVRRGTVQGYIELKFSDKSGKKLIASWECHRANKKLDGNFKYNWQLTESDGTLVGKGPSEMGKLIPKVLGMTYEQFCKTAMLAQGDFTRFLKAEEKEKSDILEKLTGTEIYTSIGRQIQQIASDKRREKEEEEAKLEGISLLADEQIAEKEAEKKRISDENALLGESIRSIEGKSAWLKDSAKAVSDLQKAETALKETSQKTESAENQQRRKLIRDWDQTVEIRKSLADKQNADKELSELELKKEGLNNQYQNCCKGYNWLEARKKELSTEKSRLEEELKPYAEHAATYEQIVEIKGLFKQYGGNLENINDNQNSIGELDRQILSKKQEEENKNKELEQLKKDLEEKDTALTRANEELAELKLDSLNNKSQDLTRQIQALSTLSGNFKNKHNHQNELSKLENEIKDIQTAIEAENKNIKDLKIDDLEKKSTASVKRYEDLRSSCETTAQDLRKVLHKGSTCPVCGKIVEEELSDQHFLKILEPLKLEKETDETNLTNARSKRDISQGIIKSKEAELERKSKEVTAKEKQIESDTNILEQSSEYETYKDSENPQKSIQKKINEITEDRNQVTEQINLCSKKQADIVQLQEEKDNANKKVTDKNTEIAGIKADISFKENSKEEKRNNVNEATGANENLIKELETKISIDGWKDSWKKDRMGFQNTLEQDAKRFTAITTSIANNDTSMNTAAETLANVVEFRTDVDSQKWEWLTPTDDMKEDRFLVRTWSTLITGINSYKERRTALLQKRSDAQTLLNHYFDGENHIEESRLLELNALSIEKIQELRGDMAKIERELNAVQTTFENAREKLKETEANRPTDLKEDDLLENLAEQKTKLETTRSSNEQMIGSLSKELETNRDNCNRFKEQQEKISTAEAIYEKWQKLNILFGQGDGKKFRIIAQSYILEHLLVCANRHLSGLSSRYELTCQPGSLTILLKDMDAGGEIRPVNTFSGGESFLASLSLALGLSSLAKADISMDTIFIDEGFGTLDKDYLDTVLDCLERLHQDGGKRVGIISHVDLLKERITAQIQLSRKNNSTASDVKVVSLI